MSETQHLPEESDAFSAASQYADLEAERRASRARGMLKLAEEWPDARGADQDSDELEARRAALIEQYQQKFPEGLHGVTVLAELPSMLETQAKVRNPEIPRAEKKEMYRQLTEYQFLMTSFILNNGQDKKYMSKFWDACFTISRKETDRGIAGLRSGVLSTVATVRAFEELGFSPQLSHPSEDAYDAIDVWADGDHAVQVKKHNNDNLEFYETDQIEFPGVQLEGADRASYFSTRPPDEEVGRFRMKVDRYSRRVGKPVNGYFVRVPYSMIDHDTGKPSQELLEQMKANLAPEVPEQAA